MKRILKNELLVIFIISILTGLLGQTLIPTLSSYVSYKSLKFDCLISNIDIYTFVIVFLICYKNPEPKQCFKRIVIYFVGLCLGYYGFTSGIAIYDCFVSNRIEYLINILADIQDSVVYIVISIFAGSWGYIMTKYQNKKKLFYIMTLPFILVSMYYFYENIFECIQMHIVMGIVDVICIIGIIICVCKKNREK